MSETIQSPAPVAKRDDQHPVVRFYTHAVANGWRHVTPYDSEIEDVSPDALRIGGFHYHTLISPDGHVQVAVSGTDLYVYKNRVWVASSHEWSTDRLTLAGIHVDPAMRGLGKASQALRFVMASTDKLGMTLTLQPQHFEKLGVKQKNRLTDLQLRNWYKRHGFECRKSTSLLMEYPS